MLAATVQGNQLVLTCDDAGEDWRRMHATYLCVAHLCLMLQEKVPMDPMFEIDFDDAKGSVATPSMLENDEMQSGTKKRKTRK